MIAEVIVGISDNDVECHPSILFFKILLNITAVLNNEINNVCIAITGGFIVTIGQSEES